MVRFNAEFTDPKQIDAIFIAPDPADISFNLKNQKIQVQFDSLQQIETKETQIYTGETTVVPDAHEQQILKTSNKKLLSDITVLKVPFFETANESGNTIYIASGEEQWQ